MKQLWLIRVTYCIVQQKNCTGTKIIISRRFSNVKYDPLNKIAHIMILKNLQLKLQKGSFIVIWCIREVLFQSKLNMLLRHLALEKKLLVLIIKKIFVISSLLRHNCDLHTPLNYQIFCYSNLSFSGIEYSINLISKVVINSQ